MTESTPGVHLGVMAKYWHAGRVKTRLGATIGMTAAAMIHQAFCRHLAKQLACAADRRSFFIDPPDRHPEFLAMLPDSWQIEYQSDGDLGDRIRGYFQSAGRQCDNAVLIGADCPLIDAAIISDAARQLADHDVVLGPAVDGGYYLIGLRGCWAKRYERLIDRIPWSTTRVLEITLERSRQSDLRVAMLPEMEDVDTEVELDRLRTRLGKRTIDHWGSALRSEIEAILDATDRPTENESRGGDKA